jgi:poly(A) polymerase
MTSFPREVKFLFSIFNTNSLDDIRLVGGAVRDYLLGRRVGDYDFATKHRPETIIKILEKNKIKYHTIGLKYGTVTALLSEKGYEITTLRKDINQRGRDTDVAFVEDYKVDAHRRDFTFNALYMDNIGKIYDYCGGLGDLRNGYLKFIGNPEERIREDKLRILRFFRFFCTTASFLDHDSLSNIKKYGYLVGHLSPTRITQEFFKILGSNYPVGALKIMEKCSILEKIFPQAKKFDYKNLEIFYSTRKILNLYLEEERARALSIFLPDGGVKNCNLILGRKEKRLLDI